MIKSIKENSEFTIKDIKFGNINITKVIVNTKIIWLKVQDIILGVFNSGRWLSENIWSNSEIWKNS